MSKATSEVLGDCDGNGTLKMFVEKAPICSKVTSSTYNAKPYFVSILFILNVSDIFVQVGLDLLCMHCIVCRERA